MLQLLVIHFLSVSNFLKVRQILELILSLGNESLPPCTYFSPSFLPCHSLLSSIQPLCCGKFTLQPSPRPQSFNPRAPLLPPPPAAVPEHHHCLEKKSPPSTQPEPPLMQLEATLCLCPSMQHHWGQFPLLDGTWHILFSRPAVAPATGSTAQGDERGGWIDVCSARGKAQ